MRFAGNVAGVAGAGQGAERPSYEELEELEELVAELRAENAALRELVEESQRRLSQDSRNSSHPPSSDPPKSRAERRREARAKAKELSRKAGGQPGHVGKHREMASPEQVDQSTEHWPEACSCGHRFSGSVLNAAVFRHVDAVVGRDWWG